MTKVRITRGEVMTGAASAALSAALGLVLWLTPHHAGPEHAPSPSAGPPARKTPAVVAAPPAAPSLPDRAPAPVLLADRPSAGPPARPTRTGLPSPAPTPPVSTGPPVPQPTAAPHWPSVTIPPVLPTTPPIIALGLPHTCVSVLVIRACV